MKMMLKLAMVAALVMGFALIGGAAEEAQTLTGKVVCGKCTLNKAAACQNVLVTAEGTEYYLAKSEAADKFGHVCKGEKTAKATGSVSEKDGKKWLTASAMEETKAN
jgi:hypothetical protein